MVLFEGRCLPRPGSPGWDEPQQLASYSQLLLLGDAILQRLQQTPDSRLLEGCLLQMELRFSPNELELYFCFQGKSFLVGTYASLFYSKDLDLLRFHANPFEKTLLLWLSHTCVCNFHPFLIHKQIAPGN